jgi:flagellar hook-associated protein 2
MPTITFGGLASGLDTNSIVTGLVNAERAPITLLQRKQSDTQSQLSLMQDIGRRLQTLQTKAQDMDTLSEFEALKATSSDDSKVSVTADSTASAGSMDIGDVVLALGQKTRSNTFTNVTDPTATGTLIIHQGGTDYNIQVDGTNNTPDGLVTAINSEEGLNVRASLFYDGSQYRILLNSTKTGTDQAFTVDERGLSGGTLPGFDQSANQIQTARNASFTVDGQPVTSQSNTVSNVLPGLSFTLKQEFTGSTVGVEVAPDADAVVAKVQAFVTAYNDVHSAIAAQFTYNGNGQPVPSSSLFGDSTLRSLQQSLSSAVTASVSGLPDTEQTLSQVGLSLDRDGTLTLDETKLRSAVNTDLRSVAKVFAKDDQVTPATVGIMSSLGSLLQSYLDPASGLLKAKEDGLSSEISDLGDRIDSMNQRLSQYQQTLQDQFTALEQMMSQLQSQSSYITQALTR